MKDIQKILIPLNGTPNADAALATGLIFAQQFDAHLQAVHVQADSREVAPLAGEGLSGAMVEEMMSAAERESARRAQGVRARFEDFATTTGVVVCGHAAPYPAGASASFQILPGAEHDMVTWRARLSDMTIVPHPDSGDEVSSSETLHAVLFDSGRPVIIAPRRAPTHAGRRICVAWNGTAESAAALSGALPWLARAEAVRVLFSPSYQRRGPEGLEVTEYLRAHDIPADVVPFAPINGDVGAGLLTAVTEFGADMMCMGAYSHSRLRQLILGGVTRHVLEKAEITVLMSR
ncbi:universal stress protein UspA [Ameyamaea chiangmaiensis NBRC 103196]|uniref:Universal stress protein n=1 Tax=Ameyamaea chiangmaiensis TaxID=442969 RepID=A0A850PGM8_9PROT|nr:universal stress protein [Ameyamaea chiangmaiensis]MBS4074869.1 universal stress protein [Ameyamaea chiangmaiensis]NVN41386.1 universal stress protein [Ameyamaea chiangmaiensis]GBQ63045.1 universal stress protein UspA [Ameyamaea chiangmaiensis NBRC 103196]